MDSKGQYQLLVDSIQDYAIYTLDCLGHVATWNLGARLIKGYTAQQIIGSHFEVFFPAEAVAAGVPARGLAEAARLGHFRGEGWRLKRNGQRFWADFVITAMRDETGTLTGFAHVTQDLTQRKQSEDVLRTMEAALREERDSLRAATESSMDAFYMCKAVRNDQGRIEDFVFTYLNSNVEKMVSIPRSRLLGGKMCELLPINVALGLFDSYCRVVETGEPMTGEFSVTSPNVKCAWIRVQAVKLHDGVAITASDITERREREAKIYHLAHHDPLTGLANRSLLMDRVGQAIDRTRRAGTMVGLFLIDLDEFKQINDQHGHAAGDQVLISVAERLRCSTRQSDSVIRIGGDEFVIVMPDIQDDLHVHPYAERVLNAFLPPVVIENVDLAISCSIGVSLYTNDGSTVAQLLAIADKAMYQAKCAGKNRYVLAERPPRQDAVITPREPLGRPSTKPVSHARVTRLRPENVAA